MVQGESLRIVKYTKEEGGGWIEPTFELAEHDILAMPLCKNPRGHYLWGFIHSFVREDGVRLDAYNDAFRIGVKVCE